MGYLTQEERGVVLATARISQVSVHDWVAAAVRDALARSGAYARPTGDQSSELEGSRAREEQGPGHHGDKRK